MARAEPEHPFIGRVTERAALAAHVTAAAEGQGRVVLLAGEAGIGKAGLLEEATASLPSDRLLWGRCHETEGAPAYWPWTQALRSYVATAPLDRMRAELGEAAPEMARMVPAVRQRWADVGDGALGGDPEAARF